MMRQGLGPDTDPCGGAGAKMMAPRALAALLALLQAVAMDNGLARTPPMGWFEACPPPCPGLTPHTPLAAERFGGCTAGRAGTRSAGASRRRRWSPSPRPSSPPVCATSATSTCAPARTAPGSRPTDPGWGLQGYRWRVGELQPRGSERNGLPHAARRLGLPQPDLLLPLPGAQAWHVCVSRPLRRPPL